MSILISVSVGRKSRRSHPTLFLSKLFQTMATWNCFEEVAFHLFLKMSPVTGVQLLNAWNCDVHLVSLRWAWILLSSSWQLLLTSESINAKIFITQSICILWMTWVNVVLKVDTAVAVVGFQGVDSCSVLEYSVNVFSSVRLPLESAKKSWLLV